MARGMGFGWGAERVPCKARCGDGLRAKLQQASARSPGDQYDRGYPDRGPASHDDADSSYLPVRGQRRLWSITGDATLFRAHRLPILAALLVLIGATVPPPVAGAETCGPTVSEPIVNPGGVPPGLGEGSRLVASLRYPGAAWAHQASGHDASIFALRFDDGGRADWMRKIPVPGAHNADWEDISYGIGT